MKQVWASGRYRRLDVRVLDVSVIYTKQPPLYCRLLLNGWAIQTLFDKDWAGTSLLANYVMSYLFLGSTLGSDTSSLAWLGRADLEA
jgi:hypothetical protein